MKLCFSDKNDFSYFLLKKWQSGTKMARKVAREKMVQNDLKGPVLALFGRFLGIFIIIFVYEVSKCHFLFIYMCEKKNKIKIRNI